MSAVQCLGPALTRPFLWTAVDWVLSLEQVRGEGREQVRGEGREQVRGEGREGTDVSTIHTSGCYGDHILIVSSGSGVVSVTLSSVTMETTPAR